MRKIKSSELTGPALDWAVAKCEHDELAALSIQFPERAKHYPKVSPSTDWAQAGPIIEREGIEMFCNLTSAEADQFIKGTHSDWRACLHRSRSIHYHGQTPIIAAMRCFCASKLGNDVEVPAELLER